MFLQMTRWEEIRDQFSKEEKTCLNAAITGEVLCPKGCIVDNAQLGEKLELKLRSAIEKKSL